MNCARFWNDVDLRRLKLNFGPSLKKGWLDGCIDGILMTTVAFLILNVLANWLGK